MAKNGLLGSSFRSIAFIVSLAVALFTHQAKCADPYGVPPSKEFTPESSVPKVTASPNPEANTNFRVRELRSKEHAPPLNREQKEPLREQNDSKQPDRQ